MSCNDDVDVRKSRTRALGALVALVLSVAMPVSQLAIAGAVTVTCCCGPHDGDHHCGCDDCPALDDGDASRGSEPGMSACRMDGDPPTLPWAPAVVVPERVTVHAPAVRRWRVPDAFVPPRSRTIRPPCPDG